MVEAIQRTAWVRERYPIAEVGSGAGGHRQFEWVYTIQVGAFCKIGKSSDVEKRLETFVKGKGKWKKTGTFCPSPKLLAPSAYEAARIVVAWKVDGRVTTAAERYLQLRMRRHRVSPRAREWFRCHPEAVLALKAEFDAHWRAELVRRDAESIAFEGPIKVPEFQVA
jgi:hypothetical protein